MTATDVAQIASTMLMAGLPVQYIYACSLIACTCQGQSQLSSAASHHYTIEHSSHQDTYILLSISVCNCERV